MRDLAPLGVCDQDTCVIKQKAGCPIQFDFGLFIKGLGGDKRDFSLSHGRLVLQHQS